MNDARDGRDSGRGGPAAADGVAPDAGREAWHGGWWSAARALPSPNFDARPAGVPIDLLVIHHISLPPEQFGSGAIADFFVNRLDPAAHPYFATIADLRVSSHFLIERTGAVTQFVSCDDRAWHAGVSAFCGRERCNDFAIGIELEGSDTQTFDAAQYQSLARLTRALVAQYPLAAIAGHSDIAPGRKTDPGVHFDWARYASEAGIDAGFFPFGMHFR